MEPEILLYKKRLGLENASFSLITHDNATVARVFKITQLDGTQLILKIHAQAHHYTRELYLLNFFDKQLPVPKVVTTIPPEKGYNGALVMNFLPGILLETFTKEIAYQLGFLLATIHSNRMERYEDFAFPDQKRCGPRVSLSNKFNEALEECKKLLPKKIVDRCRVYFNSHLHLVDQADGPCIVHRDFRPGNVLVHNGSIVGIIDWSSSLASFAQEDFWFLESGETYIDQESLQSFLYGYGSIRPVPDYTTMMQLLRIVRAINTIGFTIKRGTWNTTCSKLYERNRHVLDTLL